MAKRLILFVCLLLLAGSRGFAAEPSATSAHGIEFFEKHIRPLLAEHCYQCHSAKADKLKGGLFLDSRAGVLKGGKDGPILVPFKSAKSKLIEAVSYTNKDLQMPPKQQLSADDVALLTQWINMGAPDPRIGAAPALPPAYDYAKEKRFWSFQPVKDVVVPEVKHAAGLISPIDSFLQAQYESRKLRPVGPASKRVLIRRVTYDLIGLPPTPDEIEAFVADTSPEAFEKVVDRLLASPHYGEQWGRHWLDVIRYADTSGCNSDFPIPDLYKYRNYVIDSFNSDKPYDQFVREQLAGDLMPARDETQKHAQMIATGYIALSRRFGSNGNEFNLTIADTLDNLGKATMGLSIGCARCHDHKFDPIPTRDYYALYGIFDSTRYSFPGTEVRPHPTGMVPLGTPAEGDQVRAYEQTLGDLDIQLRKLHNEKLAVSSKLKAVKQPAANAEELEARLKQIAVETHAALVRQQGLDQQGPPNVPCAYAVSEAAKPHDVQIQHKGLATDLGELTPRGFLTILGGQHLPADETGSGRLELSRWITSPTNPLTARVIVNRIWEYHFGKGIVATPNDFGHRGIPPTDPALLDYLATRFVKTGWSIKQMHKLILLSRAYQMASVEDPANAALDPANDYLWRFDPRRLSAEEIRDSVLADSGDLDPAVDPGPHPFPPRREWHFTQHTPFVTDYPTDRRSVYLMQQRIRKQPFLAVFDGADTNDTSPDRPLSTTAIQALFMMNDPLMHDQADKLSARMITIRPDQPGQIDYAYRLLFARPANPDEIAIGQQYIAAIALQLRQTGAPDSQHAALASYLRVLLSSNEFIWLD